MKRSPLTIAIGAVLLVVFVLLLFMYQVRKSQAVVVTRFNKVVRVNKEAGPGFRWPPPIEHVYALDERIQNFDTKFDEEKLPDQNIILLAAYVGWKIEDPEKFFPKFQDGSIQAAESVLSDMVNSARREVAGRHPFPDFVSADPASMKYHQIEEEILDNVRKKLTDKGYGLDVKFIHIKQVGLPDAVGQDVFTRMTSERQFYISSATAEGEKQARKIVAEGDKTAADTVSDANAEALRLRARGEAEMQQALQVLQQNPELATFILRNDALQRVFATNSTLILDPSMPPLSQLQGADWNGSTNKESK